MRQLPSTTVEEMISLVSTAGPPTCGQPIESCRRALLTGLARMVCADLWIWTIAVNRRAILGDAMTIHGVDCGWTSEERPAILDRIMCDARFRFGEIQALETCSVRHMTHREGVLQRADEKRQFQETWEAIGISHLLLSGYPVGDTLVSCFSFCRNTPQPGFDERDRCVVHAMIGQVSWLHTFGSVAQPRASTQKLAPREREVLELLLGGDSVKSIAHKMGLSHHTIGDYVKSIYVKYGVGSRAELLSQFIGGRGLVRSGD